MKEVSKLCLGVSGCTQLFRVAWHGNRQRGVGKLVEGLLTSVPFICVGLCTRGGFGPATPALPVAWTEGLCEDEISRENPSRNRRD